MSEDAPMETAFDVLAWRTGLPDTPAIPRNTDLADWAARLGGIGHDAAAALLGDVAAIHTGFLAQSVADRAAPANNDMMTRAAVELRQLGRATAVATKTVAEPAVIPGAGDVGKIAHALRRLLEEPLADRAGLLSATLRALAVRPRIDHRAYAHAALPILVPAIAAAALIDFAQRMRDLWDSPTGSPALFHQAARLDRGGLGPYFANVGRLARHGRDVLALAGIARAAAIQAGAVGPAATLAPWIARLSRECGSALLHEIIDDLGDAAADDALSAILEAVLTHPMAIIDSETLMRLRDAGLDNADHSLAIRAQAAIARMRPESELETALLGTIQASGGALHQAKATFRGWLAQSSSNGEVRERLAALDNGQFKNFVVDRGFGSPSDRQIGRLRRRGIMPDYCRRPGIRIDAVEVR